MQLHLPGGWLVLSQTSNSHAPYLLHTSALAFASIGLVQLQLGGRHTLPLIVQWPHTYFNSKHLEVRSVGIVLHPTHTSA